MTYPLKNNPARRGGGGFTLVELLVVMAIIVLITALAIPAFNAIGGGQHLTGGTDLVAGQLDLARQTALAENQRVELRFWDLSDVAGTPDWSGVQLFNALGKALGKIQRLHQGVHLTGTEKFSTILGTANKSPDPAPPTGRPYKSVWFAPDGSTQLSPDGPSSGGNTWTVSVSLITAQETKSRPGNNFATIQVDPVTGRAVVYRP